MRFLYHALYRIVWPFFSLAHPVGARGRENIPEAVSYTHLTLPTKLEV